MTKQPSAKTITEGQAATLSELRASLMPEVNVGHLAGRVTIKPRLGGRVDMLGRVGGSVQVI